MNSKMKIDHSARAYGTMQLGNGVVFAQGTIVRSEGSSVRIGHGTMVLENSVCIGTEAHPLAVGRKTVFGHKCIAIGTTIGDLCEIGNGTIFLPGSRVGNLCIFGEGTIVPEGCVIPDGSVVVGRPGRVIRKITEADRAMIARMRRNDPSLHDEPEKIVTFTQKSEETMGKLYEYGTKYPTVDESAILYESAEITGDVVVGAHTVIASGVRIIGNSHGPVRIGNHVQILENTVLHLLPDNELIIHDHVTIGPGCIIHGTILGENTVVESGAIVCDYSSVGKNCLVKSGSLVKQRSRFPDNQILEGFPAKSIGENALPQEKPDWTIR